MLKVEAKLDGRMGKVPPRFIDQAALIGLMDALLQGRAYAQAVAEREGALVALITAMPDLAHVAHELCVDTTAAGGNAALLAG